MQQVLNKFRGDWNENPAGGCTLLNKEWVARACMAVDTRGRKNRGGLFATVWRIQMG